MDKLSEQVSALQQDIFQKQFLQLSEQMSKFTKLFMEHQEVVESDMAEILELLQEPSIQNLDRRMT